MRIVLDTNVAISALLWGGAPTRLFAAEKNSGLNFWSSEPLLAELERTLWRRKFYKRIEASRFSVSDLVSLYAERVSQVRPLPVPRVAPDPDDDVVIGTALAARAELVVTGDKKFLSVGEYKSIRIVTVLEAMALARIG